jgi:hypothetical protein
MYCSLLVKNDVSYILRHRYATVLHKRREAVKKCRCEHDACGPEVEQTYSFQMVEAL